MNQKKKVFTVEELQNMGVQPKWFTQQEINKECKHPMWRKLREEKIEAERGKNPLFTEGVELHLHHRWYYFNEDGTELHYYEYVNYQDCLIVLTAEEHMKFHDVERKSSQVIKQIAFSDANPFNHPYVGYIYRTNDYKLFNSIRSNRKPDHVVAIEKSIRENGALPSVIYVMIDKKTGLMYIVDGGNRFEAFVRLGLDIFYTIIEVGDVDEAAELLRVFNIAQKSWNKEDYARYYEMAGYDAYRTYREYRAKYPTFNAVSIRELLHGTTGIPTKIWEEGKFKVNDVEMVDTILSFCEDVKHLSLRNKTFYKNSKFIRVISILYKSKQIDLAKLLRQIEKCVTSPNANDYIYNSNDQQKVYYMIEQIMNYKNQGERIRFDY